MQVKRQARVAILDSPPGTSCPFVQTASASDYVILVTEPTPFGLSDLKQSIYTLNKIGKSYGVIINRAGLGFREIYRWLEENRITLLLEIPFKEEIAHIYSEGRILCEYEESYVNLFYGLIERISQELSVKDFRI